jgi:hypothetical protein
MVSNSPTQNNSFAIVPDRFKIADNTIPLAMSTLMALLNHTATRAAGSYTGRYLSGGLERVASLALEPPQVANATYRF